MVTVRRGAFSTGFTFNYWKDGDKMKPIDCDGDQRADIKKAPFVQAKYDNLRDEIIASGFLNAKKSQRE